MYQLAEAGKFELGQKLFDIFVNIYSGYSSDESYDSDKQIEKIARCLALYEKSQARSLKWLSQIDYTEPALGKDGHPSRYNSHLSAYIDTLAKFGLLDKLKSLDLFQNLLSPDLRAFFPMARWRVPPIPIGMGGF